MKQLSATSMRSVYARQGFSIECNPIEIARRIKAIPLRLKEIENQLQMMRRSGDKEEADELRVHYDDLQEQLKVVQMIFKAAPAKREAMYAEFYSRHGHEAPETP